MSNHWSDLSREWFRVDVNAGPSPSKRDDSPVTHAPDAFLFVCHQAELFRDILMTTAATSTWAWCAICSIPIAGNTAARVSVTASASTGTSISTDTSTIGYRHHTTPAAMAILFFFFFVLVICFIFFRFLINLFWKKKEEDFVTGCYNLPRGLYLCFEIIIMK